MRRLLLRRVLFAPVLLLCVSFAVFSLVSLMPGDPAQLLAGENADLVPYIRESLRLDDPFLTRYFNWVGGALRGDLGHSYFIRGVPVSDMIGERIGVTASLTGLSILFSMLIAMVLGVIGALRRGTVADRVITGACAAAIASPSFWLAYLLVLWFAIDHSWFPAVGYSPLQEGMWKWLWHLVLPALTLSLNGAAVLALQLRGSLLDILQRDYILSARAKGLSTASIVGKHALKNAAAPVVTLLGFQLAQFIGGSVIVESVFTLPGLGSLALAGAFGRDVPVLLGLVVFTTLVVSVINLAVDLSYGYLNPKLGR